MLVDAVVVTGAEELLSTSLAVVLISKGLVEMVVSSGWVEEGELVPCAGHSG